MEEAVYQERQGISLEVVDLRTLIPWDRETVFRSLNKTNRLIILHEAQRTGGFGAELAASVVEEAFALLDAPPIRVAAEDLPVPSSKRLEREIFAASAKLRASLNKLMSY